VLIAPIWVLGWSFVEVSLVLFLEIICKLNVGMLWSYLGYVILLTSEWIIIYLIHLRWLRSVKSDWIVKFTISVFQLRGRRGLLLAIWTDWVHCRMVLLRSVVVSWVCIWRINTMLIILRWRICNDRGFGFHVVYSHVSANWFNIVLDSLSFE
jgi:hypothetical protein